MALTQLNRSHLIKKHMHKQSASATPYIKTLLVFCSFLVAATHASAQNIQANTPVSSTSAAYGMAGLPVIANPPRQTNQRPDTRSRLDVATPSPERATVQGQQSLFAANASPTQLGAFEAYVEKVTKNKLSTFGADLFSDVPNTFAPVDAVQVNSDYIIGTGDELQIRGWGMVDIDLNTTVDRSGTIYIPRVGAVKVAGVKYRDLQGHLKAAISKIFSNFELSASISQTRAVQIYVVGHAVRPGTYTLNAMSTLLNALFASGGPNSIGTMRNIQVKRNGTTVTSFDLYDMLLKGDKTRDIPLQDGDVIHIPEVGPQVALTGNVKKPGIFELNGKSSLADLVGWAGGFDSAAGLKQVLIERNINNSYQTVADLAADQDSVVNHLASVPLLPADILRVHAPGATPIEAQVQNEYVMVAGEVKQSGMFQIKKGETLRELIARLGGVTDKGYVYATKLTRESVRRNQQEQLDKVADRFERDLEASATQRLAGSTDKDNAAIVAAEVERQRSLARKMRSIKAEGRIVLELLDGEAKVKHLPDLVLQNGDSIYIPRMPGTVDVLGAVFQSNSFMYKPHRTVNDYLALAGGASATADASEIYVIRADGTTQSARSKGWFSTLGGSEISAGDTVVVPENMERTSWTQNVKEWTSILYQFGLGAAGLKVLKD